MQNEPANQHESLWRRRPAPASGEGSLTPAERELELRLTEALGGLKDVPVSSNFTARVLAEIDREERAAARRSHGGWHGRFWLRLAGATAVLLLTVLLVDHHERVSHRLQLAQTLASVADVPAVPSVDALANFEAIQAMSRPAHADEELLAIAQ